MDARIIYHKAKKVTTLEMYCPWIENRTRKDAEKTLKYGHMTCLLKQQFKGYVVEQHNIITDVLGGWSNELEEVTQKLLGARGKDVLRSMQLIYSVYPKNWLFIYRNLANYKYNRNLRIHKLTTLGIKQLKRLVYCMPE